MRLSTTTPGRLAPVFAALVFASACGAESRDLPNEQVFVSPHFRYHARADAVLDPAIVDRLEVHRADFNETFGVTNGVIDYYLFRDQRDFDRNAGCPRKAIACESDHAVRTTKPFDEHELVHAFLEDVGSPSNPIQEGIAQWAACLGPNWPEPVTWPEAFRGDYYSLGQRLVGWMMAQGGASKLIEYYGTDTWTADAAEFSTRFQASWGQTIDAIAPTLNEARFARSACGCHAAALPTDGTPASIVTDQSYRVLELAEDSHVELTSEDGPVVVPRDCSGAYALGSFLPAVKFNRPMTLARLGAGTYQAATLPGATGVATVVARQQPFGVSSCEAAIAAPVAVGDRDVLIWIDRESRGIPTWFALAVDGPRFVSVFQNPGGVTACSDGCSKSCTKVPESGFTFEIAPPSNGTVVLSFEAGDTETDAVVVVHSKGL